jgi:hypothetical protein
MTPLHGKFLIRPQGLSLWRNKDEGGTLPMLQIAQASGDRDQ